MTTADELAAAARDAYGWRGEVVLSPGPRGALGQIWRVETDGATYALKEIFAEPPSPAAIEAELAFTGRAAAAGVRLPASHPDRHSRHLLTTPGGAWLRLYDWVDVRPADLAAPRTPRLVGTLLARLHSCATPMPAESHGGPPDRWYDTVPGLDALGAVSTSDAPWAGRLAAMLADVPELCAAVTRADPADTVVCHRDLHPDNVLAGPDGELTVVDWDNLGPAVPRRELAAALFDWYCDGDADLAAMRAVYDAYVGEGGPGRVTEPADFTMLVSIRLNFLLCQARVALDPAAEPRHRAWAERELDEMVGLLPTPRQLAAVLELTR